MNAPHVAAPDEPDFEAIAAAQVRAHRKAWLIVAGVFGTLFVLFAIAFVSDEEPPDTSDLAVPRLNPPEEQNAYAQLAKIALALPPETPEESDDENPLPLMLAGKIAWDFSVVAPILARYSPDLREQTELALALPHSESPAYRDYTDYVAPEVGAMRRLAKVLLLRARMEQSQGRHAEAAAYHLTALRIGDRLADAHGPMIHYLSAQSIRGQVLKSMREHADSTTVPSSVLRMYFEALAGHSQADRSVALATASRWEHTVFTGSLASMDRNDYIEISNYYTQNVAERIIMRLPGGLQRNKTTRWHAEATREYLADIEIPPEKGRSSSGAKRVKSIRHVNWPRRAENLGGRVVLWILISNQESLTAAFFRDQAQLHLTRIYLALRLYHLDHGGALPATLDQLVPEYLPAVPLDPFDGKPLRYDRVLTTIWSTDYERKTITTADDELPRNMAAHRLLFARPPSPSLPSYAKYLATQNDAPELFGAPSGENSGPHVLPAK